MGPRRSGPTCGTDGTAASRRATHRVGQPAQGNGGVRTVGAGYGGRAAVHRRLRRGALARRARGTRRSGEQRVIYERLSEALRLGQPIALVTVIEGPHRGSKLLVEEDGSSLGSLGDPDLDRVVVRDATGELAAGITSVRHYGEHGQARERAVSVFVEAFAPPPRMVIFGAVDFTAALARIAKVLGYHVTVCDAREVFATRKRFPMADEVVVDWPDRHLGAIGRSLGPRDAVCVLTHDAKFDVPAIMAALNTNVGYLGAMGSRRTHVDRVE